MGVLVGGESKFGSTEDEGIGGDSVEGGLDMMIEVQNTATCLRVVNHDYDEPRYYPKVHNRHSFPKPVVVSYHLYARILSFHSSRCRLSI